MTLGVDGRAAQRAIRQYQRSAFWERLSCRFGLHRVAFWIYKTRSGITFKIDEMPGACSCGARWHRPRNGKWPEAWQ